MKASVDHRASSYTLGLVAGSFLVAPYLIWLGFGWHASLPVRVVYDVCAAVVLVGNLRLGWRGIRRIEADAYVTGMQRGFNDGTLSQDRLQ